MGTFTPGPFSRFFKYQRVLERELRGEGTSLLDVGCGSNSPIRRFAHTIPVRVGVDGFATSIEASRRDGIHTAYHQLDLVDIGTHFAPGSFDCVLASDVIEHFTKTDGLRLMAAMERIARRKVLIFTPTGFLPQTPYEGNAMQAHLSGWDVDEMRDHGYRVIGINGWQGFFGEGARIAWRPKRLWKRIAWLSRGLTATRPHLAYQILCVKTLGSAGEPP